MEEVNAVDMSASGDVPILFMETEISLGVLNAFLVSASLMQKKTFFLFLLEKIYAYEKKGNISRKELGLRLVFYNLCYQRNLLLNYFIILILMLL